MWLILSFVIMLFFYSTVEMIHNSFFGKPLCDDIVLPKIESYWQTCLHRTWLHLNQNME